MSLGSDTQPEEAPATGAPGPEPFLRGVFAAYDLPDGGVLVSYRGEGQEQDEHTVFPAMLVSLARDRAEGKAVSPRSVMRALFASMGG